ncbi:uncharacterized protein CLUP02_11490 [Colletotrichum lupini]|uniref:Uncharacterized protein n=1 Tax=Colletotrichum lupini TaxID=145971 RepID=A0A9Q8T0D3_9PEZI|nr:uncharacterized protein CLUP02_11490 [Colletotrichum lupini]UQC85991.1 hypothetical protein CLUP02_11490 [Colletotrichum lupini]
MKLLDIDDESTWSLHSRHRDFIRAIVVSAQEASNTIRLISLYPQYLDLRYAKPTSLTVTIVRIFTAEDEPLKRAQTARHAAWFGRRPKITAFTKRQSLDPGKKWWAFTFSLHGDPEPEKGDPFYFHPPAAVLFISHGVCVHESHRLDHTAIAGSCDTYGSISDGTNHYFLSPKFVKMSCQMFLLDSYDGSEVTLRAGFRYQARGLGKRTAHCRTSRPACNWCGKASTQQHLGVFRLHITSASAALSVIVRSRLDESLHDVLAPNVPITVSTIPASAKQSKAAHSDSTQHPVPHPRQ